MEQGAEGEPPCRAGDRGLDIDGNKFRGRGGVVVSSYRSFNTYCLEHAHDQAAHLVVADACGVQVV